MFTRDAAPRIHRLEHARTNLYVVEDSSGLILVDAGLPATEALLARAMRELGRGPEDIRALVLTHAHFDHIGFAKRLQRRFGIPVYADPGDHYIAAHPYRYKRERSPLLYPFRYPRAIPVLTAMAAAGALVVPGVPDVQPLTQAVLDTLPGSPVLVPVPGHTAGSVALWFRERDTVVSGDALVTLDPYTGRPGPQIVARAATADSTQALDSLAALGETGASIVLPGHGDPWTRGARSAVSLALKASAH
jgi:glyoxylase-like metal-dependent hydrolase (beta-lactamase superfamily II)